MTDYSTPIGWWCLNGPNEGQGCLSWPICADCIPVYAVIPEGEREEGETRAEMEASAEVVATRGPLMTSGMGGLTLQFDYLVTARDGANRGKRLAANTVGDVSEWGCHTEIHWAGDVPTEADAVLWVVEGWLK